MTRLSDLIREQAKGSPQPGGGSSPADTFQVRDSLVAHRAGAGDASGSPDVYDEVRAQVAHLGQRIRSGVSLELDRMVAAARILVATVQQNDALLLRVLSGREGHPLLDNPVNVAVLSIKIGLGLQLDGMHLERIAAAALLHDAGMFTLPEPLVLGTEALTQDDRTLLQQHPQRGADLLLREGTQYEWLATVARQEHERWDGSGYPAGLKGTQIHEFAQIVGLADIVDALINRRLYRRPLMPHHAVRELLVREKSSFAHPMLKVAVEELSMYPLGTVVRLNTGEVGMVAKLNRRFPLRPILQVGLQDEPGQTGSGKTLDLSQTTAVYIVEVVKPAEPQRSAL